MQHGHHLLQDKLQRALTAVEQSVQYPAWFSHRLLQFGLLAGLGMCAVQVHAARLPSGEQVVAGQASFDRSVMDQLTIRQTGSKLITNWDNFAISANGRVRFIQPDANSIALNRVVSRWPLDSQIDGQLSANGQLVLVNPAGITIGKNGQISASSVVASTLDIADTDFMSGNLQFTTKPSIVDWGVTNYGTIKAGNIWLLGPRIINEGRIQASGGNVQLTHAAQVNLSSGESTINPLSYGSMSSSGLIQARQINNQGGRILLQGLSGTAVFLNGTLTADDSMAVTGHSLRIIKALALNGNSSLKSETFITVAGDITLASNKSLTLTYGTPSEGGNLYLNNATKINLRGSDAKFSVNGENYQVIQNLNQLQTINQNLSGNYVLGQDIDATRTRDWHQGAGFVPLGGNTVYGVGWANFFTGKLDGLGHRIDGLHIQRPDRWGVGLIGAASGATVQNIGLSNIDITGNWGVGGLIGSLGGGHLPSVIRNSYTTGTLTVEPKGVTSGGTVAGGLIGSISGSYNTAPGIQVSNVYSTVSIDATAATKNAYLGGLIGGIGFVNNLNIANTYFAGSIHSTAENASVGGLLGGTFHTYYPPRNQYPNDYGYSLYRSYLPYNDEYVDDRNYSDKTSISGSYVSGALHGQGFVGGLVGYGDAGLSINNSYIHSESTGIATAIGNQVGSQDNVRALNAQQAKQASSYAFGYMDGQDGFWLDRPNAWRIYDGYTVPLLAGFLKRADVQVDAVSYKTYDGKAVTTPGYSIQTPNFDASHLYGTATMEGSGVNARNAGNYYITLAGLYSDQQGYDLKVHGSTFQIYKADLRISSADIRKTYDGTTSASGQAVAGYGTQLFGSDTLTGGTFVFSDKNVGIGNREVTVSGVQVNDGNNGNNYNVYYWANNTSSIRRKALTLSTVANTKAYDGSLSATARPLADGIVRGDRVTGLSQQYADASIGDNKTLLIKPGYVIQDGNEGRNYRVTEVSSNDGVITAH
jgi:filamentous hemagglutinin family protein